MKSVLFAFILLALCCETASAQFSYQTLAYPGAINTFANGIKDNTIVGAYTLTSSPYPYHGFIFDGSSYSALDYPGSLSTVLTDSDGGKIVGYYDVAGGNRHGFIYDNGVFTTLDDPLTS